MERFMDSLKTPRRRVNLDLASIKWGTRNGRIVLDTDF
jgi:hypothetical protein